MCKSFCDVPCLMKTCRASLLVATYKKKHFRVHGTLTLINNSVNNSYTYNKDNYVYKLRSINKLMHLYKHSGILGKCQAVGQAYIS